MYCEKCGFITKGKEQFCPYCGHEYKTLNPLNRKKKYFNWLEISPKQIINILSLNIFFILCSISVIIKYNANNYSHIMPWSFIVIFGFLIAFNYYINLKEKKSSHLFLKLILFLIISGALLSVSYGGNAFETEKCTHFVFGYYFPIGIGIIIFLNFLRLFVEKQCNLISVFFSALTLTILSLLLFILTLNNVFQLASDFITQLINIISFSLVVLIFFNSVVFAYMKLKHNLSILG